MAFKIFLICLLLSSCAQIQSLEGGERDTKAPKPWGMYPANETVNFTGSSIAITFDEYVKLNNPNQTISIIPNDVKIKSELKNKTLLLYWDENLRDSTTYSIFLNRTVKDITESNDSIMQIVFSTGSFIDSLQYTTFVVDAKDASPKKNTVVGLFHHEDSLQPIYIAQTDNNGKATFNYLRKGTYYVRAFEDLSKQGKIGKNDAIGFKENPIVLDTIVVDSLPIKMFAPLTKPKITIFNYTAPNMFVVSANRSLENTSILLNNVEIPQNQIKKIEKDSIILIATPGEESFAKLFIEATEWSDSVKTRIPNVRKKVQKINILNEPLLEGNPIVLSIPDFIHAIDTSKIKILQISDSSYLNFSYSIENPNELHIHLPNNLTSKEFKIQLQSGAIVGTPDWEFQAFEQTIKLKSKEELGILNLTLEEYDSSIIIEMILNGKTVKKTIANQDYKLQFTNLEPGDYTFKIIVDKNQNGQWDTGDFFEKIQAEEIHYYSVPTKIRANWEIDLTLSPSKLNNKE